MTTIPRPADSMRRTRPDEVPTTLTLGGPARAGSHGSIVALSAGLGLWSMAALPAIVGGAQPFLVVDLALIAGLVGLMILARSEPILPGHAGVPSRPWHVRALGRGSVSTVLPSAATAAAALGVLAVVLIGVGSAPGPAIRPADTSVLANPPWAHWLAAALVMPLVALAVWLVRRARPPGPAAALLATGSALYAVEMLTGLAAAGPGQPWWVAASHLWIGAASWACLVGAAVAALVPWPAGAPAMPSGSATPPIADVAPVPVPFATRARAYIALTKPRIIELLLVTTVPAMLLAARDGSVSAPTLAWLVAWTLVGGTLAAGSANAMNCYLDRDIDELMTRTQRRPLPAHAVSPDHALLFGLALGVASFALLLVFVNLMAALLSLLAIAFYVVIYTFLLKRSTPQNIVIGGAAGALPPVIGWAAVTGTLSATPLLLFLIVFYWTPPHFWALSIRLRRDYAAAGVPMLPVVHGIADTNKQILLYSILLVALTAALLPIGGMGAIYALGAAVLGTWFLREVVVLWRDGTGDRAIRVYKCSITYLSALFAVIALDAIWTISI
jgi:heme o synthase